MENENSETPGRLIDHMIFGEAPPTPHISLRFFSETEHPIELTALLGLEPLECHPPNFTHTTPDGAEMTFRQGVWLYAIRGPEGSQLQDGLEYLLSLLPDDSALWRQLTSKYAADIFCEFAVPPHSCSVELSPDIMRGLVERHLTLNLDMTPSGPTASRAD